MSLRLKVLVPGRVLLDVPVGKVRAVGTQGHFCLLPRHLDWVTLLRPGLLSYLDESTTERHLAVDSGTLVKCAGEIRVAVRRAVVGEDLASLRATLEAEFLRLDEQSRRTRDALVRLESGVVRRFVEMRIR
jgi:F-type H+-transporting ATPase subunit epsilon